MCVRKRFSKLISNSMDNCWDVLDYCHHSVSLPDLLRLSRLFAVFGEYFYMDRSSGCCEADN